MNKPIYLCGPIQNCTDAECMTWRQEAAKLWPGPVLDPLRRDYRGKELTNPAQLVADDLQDIRDSAGLLVWFDRPSVGTAMEIFYAKHVLGKPIVVVDARPPNSGPLSAWLVHHCDKVFEGLPYALAWLHSETNKGSGNYIAVDLDHNGAPERLISHGAESAPEPITRESWDNACAGLGSKG